MSTIPVPGELLPIMREQVLDELDVITIPRDAFLAALHVATSDQAAA